MAIEWDSGVPAPVLVLSDGGDEAAPEIAIMIHRDLAKANSKITLSAAGAANLAFSLLRLAALGGWWPAEVACGAIDQAKIDGIPTLGPDRKTQRGRKAKRGGVR